MTDFTQAADAKQFRVAHASHVSGEHRLPACSCRQPCRQHLWARNSQVTPFPVSRQAAETCRLAACAPQHVWQPLDGGLEKGVLERRLKRAGVGVADSKSGTDFELRGAMDFQIEFAVS